MGDLNEFDFDEVEVEDNYDSGPLPSGTYTVVVHGAEKRDIKSGKGQGLSVAFDVIDGEHKGRRHFEFFTLKHEKEIAEQLGRKSLKRVAIACGIDRLEDTSQLVGQVLRIKVACEGDFSRMKFADRAGPSARKATESTDFVEDAKAEVAKW